METAAAAKKTFRINPISGAVIVACGTAVMGPAALAQEALEEIVVTAQKRDQSMQDVPVAISVLGASQLTDLGITNMADYVQMFPNVSYVQLGPGSGEIYIRGISSGGNSTLGPTSNVATYLDEQPVTAVGSFLNPHIYDINRIETLAGPQGTLFGANAQSGAIRIITNQPDPSQFSAGYDVEVNSISSASDLGYLLEGFVNIPISDTMAVRLVGWLKEEAGYIDNVPYTHTFSNANVRAGLTDPALIAIAADIVVDNDEVAEKNFNEATTTGARAALKWDFTDSWTVTASLMGQNLDSQGVWDHDPFEVGDLKVRRLMPDNNEDEWLQGSLVLEGQLGSTTLTYAGSYLDRDAVWEADYSLYSDYYISFGFVQRYYSCYVTYYGDCTDPRESLTGDEDWNRENHEIRLASSGDSRFRWMVGAFYEDGSHHFDYDWHVLGLVGLEGPGGIYCGQVGGNPVNPPRCTAAIDAPDIYWTTDQLRTNKETAFFGQVQYDFSDSWTASVSARYFDFEQNLKGFSGTYWFPVETACIGNFQGCGQRQPFNADNTTEDQDTVFRANLTYNVSENSMIYGTYAEGYRPGGVNRVFNTIIGGIYTPDIVSSYEIGWKSTLLDGRMRLNGALYFQEWDDMQFARFDGSVSPLTLTDNVGTAESNGFEADFSLAASDSWTVSGGISINRANLTSDYYRNENDIGVNPPQAEDGDPLPRVPELKFNVASRNNWEAGGLDQYFQASLVYTGESWNSLFGQSTATRGRHLQESYTLVNAAWGFDKNNWGAEVFLSNVFDERGQVFRQAATWDSRVTTNRPRTLGIRFRQRFGD